MNELKALLQAQSVAVIGASAKPGALGHRVIDNLHRSGFTGAVLPVHPRHPTVLRIHCHRSVEALPFTPDLAIVCTPAQHQSARTIPMAKPLERRSSGPSRRWRSAMACAGSVRARRACNCRAQA